MRLQAQQQALLRQILPDPVINVLLGQRDAAPLDPPRVRMHDGAATSSPFPACSWLLA